MQQKTITLVKELSATHIHSTQACASLLRQWISYNKLPRSATLKWLESIFPKKQPPKSKKYDFCDYVSHWQGVINQWEEEKNASKLQEFCTLLQHHQNKTQEILAKRNEKNLSTRHTKDTIILRYLDYCGLCEYSRSHGIPNVVLMTWYVTIQPVQYKRGDPIDSGPNKGCFNAKRIAVGSPILRRIQLGLPTRHVRRYQLMGNQYEREPLIFSLDEDVKFNVTLNDTTTTLCCDWPKGTQFITSDFHNKIDYGQGWSYHADLHGGMGGAKRSILFSTESKMTIRDGSTPTVAILFVSLTDNFQYRDLLEAYNIPTNYALRDEFRPEFYKDIVKRAAFTHKPKL